MKLLLALKTSTGVEVHLRAGREAGWPHQADMPWVRMVDGEPIIAKAKLALEWCTGEERGSVMLWVDWSNTEAFEGADERSATDEDDTRCMEWADTFCAEINAALRDGARLWPYADMHWHEIEAAKLWRGTPGYVGIQSGSHLRSGEYDLTAGESSLADHFESEVFRRALERCVQRAATQYEEMSSKLEREQMPGPRDVPPEVLEQATSEMTGKDRVRCPGCWDNDDASHFTECRFR